MDNDEKLTTKMPTPEAEIAFRVKVLTGGPGPDVPDDLFGKLRDASVDVARWFEREGQGLDRIAITFRSEEGI